MQRLTKYPLLLKAIHKKTVEEEMKGDVMAMVIISAHSLYTLDQFS
jgi:hypothetical protein